MDGTVRAVHAESGFPRRLWTPTQALPAPARQGQLLRVLLDQLDDHGALACCRSNCTALDRCFDKSATAQPLGDDGCCLVNNASKFGACGRHLDLLTNTSVSSARLSARSIHSVRRDVAGADWSACSDPVDSSSTHLFMRVRLVRAVCDQLRCPMAYSEIGGPLAEWRASSTGWKQLKTAQNPTILQSYNPASRKDV